MISPVVFFHFFKTLILRVASGVKGQKMSQNDKKFCLSRFISKESSIVWFDLLYTCVKSWYLQVFSSFFIVLIFFTIRGLKGTKMKKILHPSRATSQEHYSIWSWFLVHLCNMIISSGHFFIFSKFWFFELLVELKGKK